MQIFAVLCLAAAALARPQEYGRSSDATTTVTERTFTVRGDADKYYGSAYGSAAYNSGASSYSSASSAAPAKSYSFQTVASAQPAAHQYYQQYYQQAAPVQQAYYQQYQQAAPVQQAYYQQYQQAAPVQQAYYQTVTAAPAVAYQTASVAPAVAYHTASVAPAVAYQTATVAPAVYQSNLAPTVGIRAENNFDNSFQNQYETSFQQSQVSGADTKIYKHVYAFAAPEEPTTRARISVKAPVSKRKHYKLVFIKAPSQQTVVDSDITLPAQEEEKTLIYVLSKNQKQVQPEIRIKQAESSKHDKPEVFFLKYKNEAEAQSIASGAINGQNANVPAEGEIISDGSVSILGQSSGSGFSSGSFDSSAFGSSSFGSSQDSASLGFDSSVRSGAGNAVAPNVVYRTGFGSGSDAGLSAVSAGTVGLVAAAPVAAAPVAAAPVAAAPVTVAPVAIVGQVAAAPAAASSYSFGTGFGSGFGSGSSFGAGLSSGFSAYSANQEPASVAIKVTSEPAESFESSTAASLAL